MEQFASCYKWRCCVLGDPSPVNMQDPIFLKETELCGPLSSCRFCATMWYYMLSCATAWWISVQLDLKASESGIMKMKRMKIVCLLNTNFLDLCTSPKTILDGMQVQTARTQCIWTVSEISGSFTLSNSNYKHSHLGAWYPEFCVTIA